MNILFLSRWFPYPADNGSKLRISQLLSGLSMHHRVTLISFTESSLTTVDFNAIPELKAIADIRVVPWRDYHPDSLRALVGFFHPSPRSLLDTHSAEMAGLICDTLNQGKFDLVIASQLSMAAYHDGFQGIPAIFEEIELGLFHDQAVAARSGLRRLRLSLTWHKIRGYLSRLLRSFQAYTVASERERDLFVRHFPGHARKLFVIPNCIELSKYEAIYSEPDPNQMIFSGSFKYRANYQAMQWFIREVHPRILERNPNARLIITGDHDDLPLPPARNVELAGYVKEIKPLIAGSAVSVAPLWVGGGTRLKIIEAMALGVPVVATTKGAEGLNSGNGDHILIADTPELFAECVSRIMENADQRRRLSNNARRYVAEHFSWDAKLPHFLQLVETTVQSRYNLRGVTA